MFICGRAIFKVLKVPRRRWRTSAWHRVLDITDVDDFALRYSICTFVTKPKQYHTLIKSMSAHGFGADDCEFLYINNYDAFSGINKFLGYPRESTSYCAIKMSFFCLMDETGWTTSYETWTASIRFGASSATPGNFSRPTRRPNFRSAWRGSAPGIFANPRQQPG